MRHHLPGVVIIREDSTCNLLLPDKQPDMALSFKHLMMMGFALGLGNEDERMHKVPGTILNEAEAKEMEAAAQKREEWCRARRAAAFTAIALSPMHRRSR